MPGWPSAPERRALDAFPGQIGPEDLEPHFKLSPADRRFVPDELTALLQPALLSLCDQLEADPGELAGYRARGQTRTDQFADARRHAAFRAWDAMESGVLEHWQTVRAMEHQRPKALFTLAAEQLHPQQIARPSVEQIVRLIGAARERAHQANVRRARRSAHRPRQACAPGRTARAAG